jgi:hypothetical protein
LGLTLSLGACLFAASLPAQTETEAPSAPAPAAVTPPPAAPTPDAAPGEGRNRRRDFDPAAMQARLLGALRTQLVVPDDAEWTIISERVMKVFELRRNSMGGFGGFGGRGGRYGAPADPAQEALKQAVTDNLPDAEIKARLAKFRDARKQTEAELDKAREDLRAVLSVRQEAVAVMAGLLN